MTNSTLVNAHLEGDAFFWEAGPVGVFLSHGFTATSAEVRLLAQRLHAAGYTVAGPLLPGHGTAPEDLNRTTWRDWVRDGEAVYGRLAARCEKVFVGGESMGGVLALHLAAEHPEAAGAMAYAPAIKLALTTADLIRLHLFAPFMASVPKGASKPNDHWQGYPVNPLKGVIQLLRFGEDVRRRLPRIRQPILVVQGRLDTTVAPEAGDIIMQGVGSTIKEHYWMEQSTHVVLLDCELDRIAELTLRFVERALETNP